MLVVMLSGCARGGEVRFARPEERLLTIQPSGPGEIAFVVAARMTEGARHVVVLDAAPPFVKVFDRNGRLRAAFARKGSGPGEIEAPAALATSGDTAILVADAKGGVSLFDPCSAPPRSTGCSRAASRQMA